MAKTFRVEVYGDRWPTQLTIQASNLPAAGAKALRLWAKGDGKGSRATKVTVHIFKPSMNN